MNYLSRIKRRGGKAIKNPRLVLRELNRTYYTKRYGPEYNRAGFDITKADWDILIVLDACRYDMFAEQNTLPGTLESRVSRGSHTSEFLRGNFDGKELLDTVYTTATPQLERRRDNISATFHAVHNVWNGDRWNNEIGTVLPEEMTAAGIEAIEKYPNKRHIIHYLQPHYPFLDLDTHDAVRGVMKKESEALDIWGELFREGLDLSSNDIWTAYKANLDRALNAVYTLFDKITGKIVVTSDHGNMIGERSHPIPIREWGHPPRLYTPQLVTVPWLVWSSSNRREIQEETSVATQEGVENNVVKRRLEDLGYK